LEPQPVGITTFSSREFIQDVSKAKRCAATGPVFITDRGRATHVLLTIESYLKITDKEATVVELLAMPQAADIDFDPPRLKGKMFGTVDLS
jgi:hypothetical protein